MNTKQFFIAKHFEHVEGHARSMIYVDHNAYIVHEVHEGEMYIIEYCVDLKRTWVGVAFDHMHAIDLIETHRNL